MSEEEIFERFFEDEEDSKETELASRPEDKTEPKEGSETSGSETPEAEGKGEYVCPYCGKTFNSEHALKVHIGMVHKEEVEETPKGGRGEGGTPQAQTPEEPVIKSPKEELEDWFINELAKRLPQVVGKEKAEVIIQTIRDDPEIIWDPQRLRYHIIQLASKNINKYLLDWVLNSLYRNLEEYRKNFEEALGYAYPPISPPRMPTSGLYPRPYPPREGPYPRQYFRPEPIEFPEHTQHVPYPHAYRPQYAHPTPEHGGSSELLRLLDKILDKLDRREREEAKEPLVEVPNPYGEGTIKVPLSQVPTYLMLKGIQDQINALKEAIAKLQEKPKEEPKEQTVKVPTENGVIELPASQAVYFIQMMHERERRKETEERLKRVEQQMVEMTKSLSPERLIKAVEDLGFRRYPSPTYELLNKTRQDLNNMLDRILSMMELQMRRQAQLSLPQFQHGEKYTPEERQRKINEMKEKLKRAENIAKLEKEIAETIETKEEEKEAQK